MAIVTLFHCITWSLQHKCWSQQMLWYYHHRLYTRFTECRRFYWVFSGNVSIIRNSLVLVRQFYTWTLMGNNDRAASNWICRWTAFLMVWTELFLSAIIPVTSTQNIKCPRCSTNSFRARSASVENDAGRPTQNMKVLCGWWIVVIHYRYIDVERYKKCNTQGTMRFKCTISIL